MHAEALSGAAENSSSLSPRWCVLVGSSISIIIYLSLIRGISSVADGENRFFDDIIDSVLHEIIVARRCKTCPFHLQLLYRMVQP